MLPATKTNLFLRITKKRFSSEAPNGVQESSRGSKVTLPATKSNLFFKER